MSLHWINVPINEQGRGAMMDIPTNEFADENFKSEQFTTEELDKIFAIYNAINDRFGMMIDQAEEEILPAERVAEALEIAHAVTERTKDQTVRNCRQRVVDSLHFAVSSNAPVWFCF